MTFSIVTAFLSSDYVSEKIDFFSLDNFSVLQNAPYYFSHMLHYGLA